MPKPFKHEVVSTIAEVGLLPVFYNGDIETVKKIVTSCVEGGARVLEFTNRGDFAYEVFTALSKWSRQELPDVILGAGTVLDPGTAMLYINSGASFIVSPIFSLDVGRICHRRRVTYIPGCQTPTEISNAEELGVDLIKVFPAKVVTPSFFRAVLAPSPNSLLMASGGVQATRKDVFKWIGAGVKVLNIGSNLITEQAVRTGDFVAIKDAVANCIKWIKEARKSIDS